MADKKLNAVSTASDGAYIYAEDASGNQIKISKADLASVVAGLLPQGTMGISSLRVWVNSGEQVEIDRGNGGMLLVNANVLTSAVSSATIGNNTGASINSLYSYKVSFGVEESGVLSVLVDTSRNKIVIKNTIGSNTYVSYTYIGNY